MSICSRYFLEIVLELILSVGAIIKSFKKIFIIVGAIILAVVAIITAIALLSWCADKRIKEGERDQVRIF